MVYSIPVKSIHDDASDGVALGSTMLERGYRLSDHSLMITDSRSKETHMYILLPCKKQAGVSGTLKFSSYSATYCMFTVTADKFSG